MEFLFPHSSMSFQFLAHLCIYLLYWLTSCNILFALQSLRARTEISIKKQIEDGDSKKIVKEVLSFTLNEKVLLTYKTALLPLKKQELSERQ